MTTRILVTGAQGFVGRYLAAGLLRSRAPVRILGLGRSPRLKDRFTHNVSWASDEVSAPLVPSLRCIENDDRYQYESVDLEKPQAIESALSRFQPHQLVHLASGLRDDPPRRLFRCNVEGTINLLQAVSTTCPQMGQIILGSSGGVYGTIRDDELPILECKPCAPVDPYCVSKLACEQAARTIANRCGMSLVIARLFNLVGPGQDERHSCAKFISRLATIKQGEASPQLQVGRLNTTRDFVDVRDVANALMLLVQYGKPGEVYNVASGREVTMHKVLDQCLAAADLHDTVEFREGPVRHQDVPRHYANIDKLRNLGWKPQYSLAESLRDLFQYYASDVARTVQFRHDNEPRTNLHEPGSVNGRSVRIRTEDDRSDL